MINGVFSSMQGLDPSPSKFTTTNNQDKENTCGAHVVVLQVPQ
jgi:hypothetical protein